MGEHRIISYAQLKRILTGIDLEHKITGYSFSHKKFAKFQDMYFHNSLNFYGCDFDIIEFENCRFSSGINLDNSQGNGLILKNCQISSIDIENSTIGQLLVEDSMISNHLKVKSSLFDEINLQEISQFRLIDLGCKNVMKICFLKKLNSTKHNRDSKIYLCPESFQNISMDDLNVGTLHIGTFGTYSKLTLKDIKANNVTFENCDASSSDIKLQNIQPIKSDESKFHLINTTMDSDIFPLSEMSSFSETKIIHDN